VRKSLKPKGFGPDINTEVDKTAYEFGPITISQTKGVFLFFSIGIAISLLVILIELFQYHYFDIVRTFVLNVWHNSRIIFHIIQIYYLFVHSNRVNG